MTPVSACSKAGSGRIEICHFSSKGSDDQVEDAVASAKLWRETHLKLKSIMILAGVYHIRICWCMRSTKQCPIAIWYKTWRTTTNSGIGKESDRSHEEAEGAGWGDRDATTYRCYKFCRSCVLWHVAEILIYVLGSFKSGGTHCSEPAVFVVVDQDLGRSWKRFHGRRAREVASLLLRREIFVPDDSGDRSIVERNIILLKRIRGEK